MTQTELEKIPIFKEWDTKLMTRRDGSQFAVPIRNQMDVTYHGPNDTIFARDTDGVLWRFGKVRGKVVRVRDHGILA